MKIDVGINEISNKLIKLILGYFIYPNLICESQRQKVLDFFMSKNNIMKVD